ncbi:GNAT family protein [Virgibacillus sp. 179-BFC.A HS]|uniref:GNAT family protein n=1 Tax=Tigheibacillus jepli TaxID=3035914 RepID=A0ABU5CFD9_9BACI|nr:GNAT family protein [Virgibacillus sp. 179-BFC.A HS]MDY0405049.1 GNAT family protein [Virgibacillus sp. 179-BFC.A HS]
MSYTFKKLTQEQAEEISYNWHYEGIYSFYDMEADQEDLEEFLDAKQRGDSTFAVLNDNELIGFFSFSQTDANTIDIGLGMRPDLTGVGKGLSFLKEGLAFAKAKYSPNVITLSVATFNNRAIKVYKKAGFEPVETFVQETNDGHYDFLKMKYKF